MHDSGALDCTACGACCRCFPVFASNEDAEREVSIKTDTKHMETHMQSEGKAYRLFPLPFLEGCAFLGKDQLCKVYETRPDVCRRFEKGSEQCLEARERVGF